MKKGCFIKIIILLTIFVAAGLYIIQNYSGRIKNLILSRSKEKLKEYFIDKYDVKLAHIKPSPQKDTLEVYLRKYFEKNFSNDDELNDKSEDKINNFIGSIEDLVQDSIVTEVDVNKIKKLVNQE
jgi:hypothetical protein